MAVVASILPVVSRCSTLTLEIYQVASTTVDFAKDLSQAAGSISNFALVLKQVGTIIKEDDGLPSLEAIESLEDIIAQCLSVLDQVGIIIPARDDRNTSKDFSGRANRRTFRASPESRARLRYLSSHLNSLKSTLAVMLQTLYTAQGIMWARIRPTISPQQATTAVSNEKSQLEMLIIEQQISICSASIDYANIRSDAQPLVGHDSSQSVVAINRALPQPGGLLRWQNKSMIGLHVPHYNEQAFLAEVRNISRSQLEQVLGEWTRLQQFEELLAEEDRKAKEQRRGMQQPTVESASEGESVHRSRKRNQAPRLSSPTPRRPGSVQPLFTETKILPIPVPDSKYGPAAPLSPASSFGGSPRSFENTLSVNPAGSSPVSPRSSITNLPVDAAAAVSAQASDPDSYLKIPWTLRTRSSCWKHIDDTVIESNTELPASTATHDRSAYTEITAAWVAKEALKEGGYEFRQLSADRQKEREGRAGRKETKTVFEPCFSIYGALSFDEVRSLVERTVELFRQNRPPTPPPRSKREDAAELKGRPMPNDRTNPVYQHPKMERSTSALTFPPPPPPLDRTHSLPSPNVPTYPANPHPTALHLPLAQSPYPSQAPPPCSPQTAPYPPPGPFSPSFQPPAPFNAPADPRRPYPPHPNNVYPHPNLHPPVHSHGRPHSPLRHQHADPRERYSNASTASDSEDAAGAKERRRRERERRRRESSSGGDRSKKKKGAAMGALVGVGGLTALLDGLVGL
ncbi:hypothetical protein BS50DRAFT_640114 [Corynespora cassiicola Philippines]|uniref:Fungal N-terminal domain-containing protein n=1 Tax=Corynespora cassiicola Philippines TaxID=1448308 RepID=A0A2T2N5Q6_CORCC|nr:hypothetical protein BS50DRAFT_640114 [Corynespora cassiicola Philippines]